MQMTISMFNGQKVDLGATEVIVYDIGPGGLKFHMGVNLPVNKHIVLHFTSLILDQTFHLEGYIVWSNTVVYGKAYEYGLKLRIEDELRLQLIKTLNQLSTQLKDGISENT